ncbi:MAG: VOC family protein [Nanoarchaeota archaeon]
MEPDFVDHIILSVKDLKKSTEFYSKLLGKATIQKYDVSWKIGKTKFFITYPYKKNPKKFDKHNLGLNHIAFGVNKLQKLKEMQKVLDKNNIKNSGIKIDKYGKKEFIWFDDPDKIRLEFYLRK